MTNMIDVMKETVLSNENYKEDSERILHQLGKDITNMNEYIHMYSDVQEVYDFYLEWNRE